MRALATLPIVVRELRVTARRRRTYWSRTLAAGMGVVVFLYLAVAMSSSGWGGNNGFLGQSLFYSLSTLCFAFCLLAGVGTTSDCLAEEKREGTLGLLFLTDLKGFDVVLGKMAASSLSALYTLLSILPVLTVPLLLGGVDRELVLRMAALLLNTLFFSLSVGVAASALCRDDRRAMSFTFLVILVIVAGLPILGSWVDQEFPNLNHDDLLPLFLPSPGYAYSRITPGSNDFWLSLGTTSALSVLGITFACLWLPRSWQDTGSVKRTDKLSEKLQATIDPPDQRTRWRTALLDQNPFLWLCARKRLGPVLLWLTLGFAGAAWIAGAWRYPRDFFDTGTYVVTAFVSHLALKLWFTVEACRRFADDRQSGALELLLSTPLDPQTILRGQHLALRRMFLWPVLALLAMDAFFVLAASSNVTTSNSTMSGDQLQEFIFMFLAGILVFLVDLVTIAWLGPWLALNARTGAKAASGVVLRVLVAPWFAFWATLLAMVPVLFFRSSISEEFLLFVWAAICVGIDAFWFVRARNGLNKSFRDIATTRFDARPRGWFARLFSRDAR
jgi:ABC-type transport system involved in cytochrome c biogenesis permease component